MNNNNKKASFLQDYFKEKTDGRVVVQLFVMFVMFVTGVAIVLVAN